MRNIKLVIEYDGTKYDGWQKQMKSGKGNTIQEKIESVLTKMQEKEVTVIGAARTEAGVHAYGQIANVLIDTDKKLYEIKHYLNRFLPRDIAVLEVAEVPEQFHSAFHAKSFVYIYRIGLGEVASVFKRKYQYYSFQDLNIAKMREAAKFMEGEHDFKVFSDNKRMKKSTIRTIYKLDLYRDIEEMEIMVEVDDAWPNMIRILVGTLMEVGYGNILPDQIPPIMKSGNRELAGCTAQAKGLFLQEIRSKTDKNERDLIL